MEPEVIFSIANGMAALGWVVMAVLHNHAYTYRIIFNGLVVVFCLLYASLIVYGFTQPPSEGNFSSLQGVMTLFANPVGVLTGWVHYLAFDMLTGLFIVHHSSKNHINRWLVLPCLFFTFMLGPVGWLMYYLLFCVKRKTATPAYD